jgi:signal transduction histidine kinase
MKTMKLICSMFLIPLFFISCNKGDEDLVASYPFHEVQKLIIQTNTTNLSTGLNNVFIDFFQDSIDRAQFCRTFSHGAIFMDDGSGYVFIESVFGYNISHPFHPELEGTLSLGQTDAWGKPIVQQMIAMIRQTGYGFLEYDYENPVSGDVETKTTFVSSIPESMWYAGSGFYRSSTKEFFTEAKKNETVVKEAVSFMALGLGAILTVQNADSLEKVELMRSFLKNIRFFDDQSGYFFVIDFSGYNVVQPPDPSIQGTNEWDIQDSRGNYLVRGLIETAKNGGGFYSYYWMNYQTNTEKLKKAYVEKIPGIDYLIGSGVYMP